MAELFGIEVGDLPDGAVGIECVVLVKCIDADGNMMLAERKSDGLNTWEALGMAITFADTTRAHLQRAFEPDNED